VFEPPATIAAAAAAFVCPTGGCVGGANKSVDTPCKLALETISLVDIFAKCTLKYAKWTVFLTFLVPILFVLHNVVFSMKILRICN
jgi:hypothetical protein